MMMMSRDARGAYRYLRLLINVWFYEKLDLTVPQVPCSLSWSRLHRDICSRQVFQRTVRKHPDRVCLHFEDQAIIIMTIIIMIATMIGMDLQAAGRVQQQGGPPPDQVRRRRRCHHHL